MIPLDFLKVWLKVAAATAGLIALIIAAVIYTDKKSRTGDY